MNKDVNQRRTKLFGLGVIRLVESLPESMTAGTIGAQLLRSANTVGAKYRAACNGFTKKESIGHLRIALERCDESLYLMEMLVETKSVDDDRIKPLMSEADSLNQILRSEVLELQQEMMDAG